jgi:glycosyltransferase involved in cell wall biosynthesis
MESKFRYIIISPVKDEEKYLETTIESIIGQSMLPEAWVIIDDGSSDNSYKIANSYADKYQWILVNRISSRKKRLPGSAVINAFNHGYSLIQNREFDFVVKLDCDLKLNPDYFLNIFQKISMDNRIGIASGIYLENRGNGWAPIKMPYYHAAGASKVIRRECFEEIGGFVAQKGWDTIDEIRAQCRGWKTCHFADLPFYHLKIEGSGIGTLRTDMMHGEIHYVTGGGILFFLLKVGHRMICSKPFVLGGLLLLYGFLRALVEGKKRLVSLEEAAFYRSLLNQRITNQFKRFFCSVKS